MRLLIAGWQGQVARALVEAAPGCPDIEACAVGRPALDLCKPQSIERALADIEPDVVINSAAYTAVDQAEKEPDRAMALNCEGARLLALAAARRGVPIIHISTDYVYDGRKPTPYVESDATGPVTVYGRSKLEGELAVAAADPHHVILRTAWVYSPVGHNFVKTMLRLARERGKLRVVDDQRGSPTYAPHLASAILEIARQLSARTKSLAPWGTYHAAGSGTATWFDLACEVMRVSAELGGPSVPVEPIPSSEYPTPATRPANSELDCGKLARVFGLRLPDWRDGVGLCVRRLLEAPG